MNIGVFSSYAHYYKKGLLNCCHFTAYYSVDKIDFLEILQEARAQVLMMEIISKAWQKSGLFSSNPEIGLQQLLLYSHPISRPSTPVTSQIPSLTFTASNGEVFEAALTPRNMIKVENLVKRVLEDEALDPAIVLQIKKLSKVAVKAIANTII